MTTYPHRSDLIAIKNKGLNYLKIFILLIVFLYSTACKTESNSEQNEAPSSLKVKRQAAEYETQQAIWLMWPPADHTRSRSNEAVSLELVKLIAPTEKVIITASNDSLYQRALSVLGDTLSSHPNVKLLKIPSEEFWIRDMGPNFVELENGETAIADFGFNVWGYEDQDDPYAQKMEAYDREIAKNLGIKTIKSSIISEGGNRELNSLGTMMLTEAVSLGRNPHLSKNDLEEEFKRVLGVKKIIWMEQGLLEDQHSFLGPVLTSENDSAYTVVTTNGHIDEYARFVNDSTILLADVTPEDLNDPIGAENKQRMEKNFGILKQARTQEGAPFNIIRMPLPVPVTEIMRPGDPVYDYLESLTYTDGSVFPSGKPIKTIAAASYLNFIITNTLVIAQKYGTENPEDPNHARDSAALKILQTQFPNRKVVQLNALSVNLGGGGLHCISMQQPIEPSQK